MKDGLIRAGDLQQNLQQIGAFELLSRFGHASASIISRYVTSISGFFQRTYKREKRPTNPVVKQRYSGIEDLEVFNHGTASDPSQSDGCRFERRHGV